MDSAPDGFALFDADLNLVDVNKAAMRIFGLGDDKSAIIGRNILELCPESRQFANYQKYLQVLETGKAVFVEDVGPYTRLGGIHLSIRAFKVGKCLGIIATDITERKKAIEALAESEERFRNLMDHIPGISIQGYDTNGTVFYWNKASEQVYGYTAEEAIGKNLGDLIIPPEVKPHFERALVIGKSIKKSGQFMPPGELMLKHKGGYLIPVYSIHTAVCIPGKKPLLFCIDVDLSERKRVEKQLQKARDELELRVQQRTADLVRINRELRKEIAERQRAEKALREAEERFRTMFENTLVGLYRTTPDGRILMANPALVQMLGYSSFQEMAQLDLEKQGFDPSTPRSAFKQQMDKYGRVVGYESIWIRRDGAKLFICESAVAVKDKDGKVLYYEGTVEDITERKKAEEKLFLYQQQLRSLASELSLAEERLRRRIATHVHDNIGQNLAIAKIKLDSLRDSAASPELAKALMEVTEMIGQAIQSSRSLTFELSPPVLYELGLEPAVEWLLRNTRKQHAIATDFVSDGLEKPLDDDVRILLFQAVRELLVNVAKHAKAKNVKVYSRRVRNHIHVTVEDDGTGFDMSRVNLAGGFGLFSIRERLGHIGGRLQIRSRPQGGTRVTMTVPIDSDKRKKARTGENEYKDIAGRRP